MVDHGMQDKEIIEEKEEEHVPQSWEALVEDAPALSGFPEPKPAAEFTFAEACRFNEVYTELLAVYVKQQRDAVSADDGDEVADAVGMVRERNEVVGHLLDFFKSIVSDPSVLDAWTVGMNPDIMYMLFLDVVAYYVRSLGKSSASKVSSTGTK